MSVHLVTCARAINGIPASHKLLLLCFAENARDGSNRAASPGIEEAMLWTGLSKSRVLAATRRLEELRLLVQTERGQKHRRSVFQVFPDGCCTAHGKVDSGWHEGHPEDPPDQHDPDVSGSYLQDPETDDQACGLSRYRHPEKGSGSRFGVSGSRFGPLRVSLATPLPLELPTTELPPRSSSLTSPARDAASNVHDLSTFRRSKFDTDEQRRPHIGHSLFAISADPPTLVCESCQVVLTITTLDDWPSTGTDEWPTP
jgi:hypothetical protein